ncbi:PREDICTED: keratin-associated protein 26-1-like [Chrysochloris asiatica]|uniref:Keratin-associated protein n=1 Tax=Chrysochloris asiatica TaxID=185453 RepID=A0A9B0TBV8_CHRAS|nr:PREDICTED: keratin-associated protein 26-1-like [Chrysochloris asiatica]
MSCRNCCSGNYSSGFRRNVCHIPASSSIALCSTDMSYGDTICLPSSCQGNSWLLDNCQDTFSESTRDNCGESTICQPTNSEHNNCEASSCPPTACYVPRPCQGTSFIPVSSSISSTCLPVSCRPLNFVSSGCRPLSPLLYSSHPLGCGPIGYRPLNCFSNSCRPLSLFTYGCRPLGGLTCGPQPLNVVSSSLRPVQCLPTGYQPLTHIFSTCRPSCSVLGQW